MSLAGTSGRPNPYENVLSATNVARLHLDWRFHAGSLIVDHPAVANGIVYAGTNFGHLYALNAATGARRWSFAFYGPADPAVANGVVYSVSVDGHVHALNAATGHKLWTFTTAGVDSDPAVPNGVVYISANDNNVYALNAATGAQLWTFPAGGVGSDPVVANGKVYIGSGNNVYAFDLPGRTTTDARPNRNSPHPGYNL